MGSVSFFFEEECWCCVAMTNYTNTYTSACMQNHNNDTIKTSDTVLRKIYLSLYLKGLCVRGSWRPNRDCNILTSPVPLDIAECLSRSPGLFNRRPWGPALCWVLFSLQHHYSNSPDPQTLNWVLAFSTASAGCWLSLPHLVSNRLNFLCTELYNSSAPTQSLPINGQWNMWLLPSLEWHVLIIIKRK